MCLACAPPPHLNNLASSVAETSTSLAAHAASGYEGIVQGEAVEGRPSTVLVVEDEELVREVVVRALSFYGHTVVTAASCSEALKHPGPFHVGIFDIRLGDGCGIELAAELLRQGRVARAIFYTGGADPARITRAVDLGTVVSKGDGLEPLLRALG
jgi:ActR/RegA family two-component response regulator